MRITALITALAFATLPSFAEETDRERVEITGAWNFTAAVPEPCEFNGVAVLTPSASPRTYGCELTATQTCGPDFTITVRQSCTARRTGDMIAITSKIEEFLVGDPTPYYYPDNFTLRVQSQDRMSGSLISSASYAAWFIRSKDGIS